MINDQTNYYNGTDFISSSVPIWIGISIKFPLMIKPTGIVTHGNYNRGIQSYRI